jgi:toxin-antitoxin system PIN domain toxin
VIAYDTNLLVYAHRRESPFHERARAVVTATVEGSEPWGLLWPCAHEFLGVVTNPRIYKTPTPMADALQAVRAWAASPSAVLLSEDSLGYLDVLARLCIAGKIQGARVHDARIAALAIHHGVSALRTADRDFSRFPDLRVENPLIG